MGPVYRDLELERYGAKYVWPENQFGHVFPDGRALVCARDLDTTVENIARFSAATRRRSASWRTSICRCCRRHHPGDVLPAGSAEQDLLPLEAMGRMASG